MTFKLFKKNKLKWLKLDISNKKSSKAILLDMTKDFNPNNKHAQQTHFSHKHLLSKMIKIRLKKIQIIMKF